MIESDLQNSSFTMDPGALYREESYTDRRVGTVRMLIPVKSTGADDNAREIIYVGQTQMLTPLGALPLSFEIPAASIEEAVQGFSGAAQQAAERALEELKELQREATSSIVIPEVSAGGKGGMGGLPGGSNGPFR